MAGRVAGNWYRRDARQYLTSAESPDTIGPLVRRELGAAGHEVAAALAFIGLRHHGVIKPVAHLVFVQDDLGIRKKPFAACHVGQAVRMIRVNVREQNPIDR